MNTYHNLDFNQNLVSNRAFATNMVEDQKEKNCQAEHEKRMVSKVMNKQVDELSIGNLAT